MIVCAVDWQARIWPGLFWSVMRWAWWREYVGQREMAICGTAFHMVRDQWELGNLCDAAAVALERGDEFTARDAVLKAVAWCDMELTRIAAEPEDPREASGAWLRGWDEKRRDRRRGEKVVWSMAGRDNRDARDHRDERWDTRDGWDEERDEVAG